MLTFVVQRKIYNSGQHNNIISDVFANGKWICYILEDIVRADGIKVDGETCIPADTYDVIVNMSSRFKRVMPLIFNKPDLTIDSHGKQFAGVRVHGGNSEINSHACQLAAHNVSADQMTVHDTAEALITKMIQDAGGKAKWIVEDRGVTGGGLNNKMAA
jgi:hypothetical protein